MTDLQQGILTLIKSAVTGQPCDLPAGFSLEEAIPVIRKHQLIPLACEGAVLCGLPNTPHLMALLQGSCQHLLISEGQMQAIHGIYDIFDANGIAYMPVKGCLMKERYPKPELRPMSDADILIRTEQYDRIRSLLPELGFTELQESNHEFIWRSPALHLELHKRLIPSYNRDYYAYFGDGWRLAKEQTRSRFSMTPEDEFIYLFVHFAKHYRDGGIGCRQMVDLWVHRRTYPNTDEAYVRAELKKLRLLDFYDNICRTLELWFADGNSDSITEFITNFIFSSGSWGQEEHHLLAAEVRNRSIAGSARGGRLRSILLMIFPALPDMTMRYPVLKKAPYLLPLLWILRWIQTVLNPSSIRRKQQELKTTSGDKVQIYHENLKAVGLDFHFREEQNPFGEH